MVTISLDETEGFENSTIAEGDELVLVAGVLYEGDEEDTRQERKRIREFFKQICGRVNATYPDDLHFSSIHYNGKKVGKVKESYKAALPEFLTQGTLNGKTIKGDNGSIRKGKYYIFEYLRTREGVRNLNTDEVSDIVGEESMSNLYLHMAEESVLRNVISNPFITEPDEVTCDLATRTFVTEHSEIAEEYKSLGYHYDSKAAYDSREKRHLTNNFIQITNADVFRTALDREMIRTGRTDIRIMHFQTRPIIYDPQRATEMEFLYMCDAVCTFLSQHRDSGAVWTYDKENTYIEQQKAFVDELSGAERSILFIHDDADVSYQKAWDAIEAGDMYAAAGYISDIRLSNRPGARYYQKVWVPVLENRIRKKISASSLTAAVRKLYESTRNNNLITERSHNIFEILRDAANSENISYSNEEDKSVLYNLYDAGASIYNHRGESERARECREKCTEYEGYISIFRQIRNRNKLSVSLTDQHKCDEALEIAQANVGFYEKLISMGSDVIDISAVKKEYAVSLSQLGQVYAYMRSEEAEQVFLNSLSQYSKGTPDYYITLSYLLHYYIDSDQKEKFRPMFKEYLQLEGDASLPQMLDRIIELGSAEHNAIISLKFGLYLFIKAVDQFYAAECDEDTIKRLLNIEELFEAEKRSGYPWQLIYRHQALLYKKKGGKNRGLKNYIIKVEKIPLEEKEGIVAEITKAVVDEMTAMKAGEEYTYPETLTYMYR